MIHSSLPMEESPMSTPLPATRSATLVELLRRRAALRPEHVGFHFLQSATDAPVGLSYGRLEQTASRIAAGLRSRGRAGDRVLLLCEPGEDFVVGLFAILLAGLIPVPAAPPRRKGVSARMLRVICADCNPSIVLHSAASRPRLAPLVAEVAPQAAVVTCAELLRADHDLARSLPDPAGTDVALIQYSSGSTGNPRGTVLTHENLLTNSRLIRTYFCHTSQSRGLIWLPPYHDMGLVGGIIQPLYSGFPVHLLPPVMFARSPLRWLQLISRLAITTAGGPNSAYELCVRRFDEDAMRDVDLSGWDVAFNGSEQISAETLERFARVFEPYGFRANAFVNCYGLAESTLFVAGSRKCELPSVIKVDAEEFESGRIRYDNGRNRVTRSLVGMRILPGIDLAIVDPDSLTELGANRVGEIWIRGPSIASGYWRNQELTRAVFRARIADATTRRPFLRTGDMGFVSGGRLFVCGRLKDMIVIRGRNLFAEDIERAVRESHELMRSSRGAAVASLKDGQEQLVIVQEHPRSGAGDAVFAPLFAAIQTAIAEEFEVQAGEILLVAPGRLPVTSTGKPRRFQCRHDYLNGNLDVAARWRPADAGQAVGRANSTVASSGLSPRPNYPQPQSPIESWLRDQIARELRIDPEFIDRRRHLACFGLDSLAAASLSSAVAKHAEIEVDAALLWDYPTLESISEYLNQRLAPTKGFP